MDIQTWIGIIGTLAGSIVSGVIGYKISQSQVRQSLLCTKLEESYRITGELGEQFCEIRNYYADRGWRGMGPANREGQEMQEKLEALHSQIEVLIDLYIPKLLPLYQRYIDLSLSSYFPPTKAPGLEHGSWFVQDTDLEMAITNVLAAIGELRAEIKEQAFTLIHGNKQRRRQFLKFLFLRNLLRKPSRKSLSGKLSNISFFKVIRNH